MGWPVLVPGTAAARSRELRLVDRAAMCRGRRQWGYAGAGGCCSRGRGRTTPSVSHAHHHPRLSVRPDTFSREQEFV